LFASKSDFSGLLDYDYDTMDHDTHDNLGTPLNTNIYF
jgi:hypothetical protein